MSDEDDKADAPIDWIAPLDAEPVGLTPVEIEIEVPPLVCVWCGSTDNEGPYGEVYFCNGCGKSIRRGESQRVAWVRAREDAIRDREVRERRARDAARRRR